MKRLLTPSNVKLMPNLEKMIVYNNNYKQEEIIDSKRADLKKVRGIKYLDYWLVFKNRTDKDIVELQQTEGVMQAIYWFMEFTDELRYAAIQVLEVESNKEENSDIDLSCIDEEGVYLSNRQKEANKLIEELDKVEEMNWVEVIECNELSFYDKMYEDNDE